MIKEFKMQNIFRNKMTAVALALTLASIEAHALSCTGLTPNRICDLTFGTSPTFNTLCIGETRFGVYTIRNNTPVSIKINYIRFQNSASDGLATNATTIPSNNCGTALPSGLTCSILVELRALSLNTFNRTLQVGIDSRQIEVSAPAITSTVNNCIPQPTPPIPVIPPTPVPIPPPAPPPVPPVAAPALPNGIIAPAVACQILGRSTVTSTGPTIVNGTVCLSAPGTSITGFNNSPVVGPGTNTGIRINPDAIANQAQADVSAFYTSLRGLPCNFSVPSGVLPTNQLGGLTLSSPAGATTVYCFPTDAFITGNLILSGPGNYVFIVGTTLTTQAQNSNVILTNGATSGRVYWTLGTAATLGTNTIFNGMLMSGTANTLNTGAIVNGSVSSVGVSGTAVTLDSNIVSPAS
jgi:hypothetical protein